MLALAPGSSQTLPLAEGDAGIAQTIAAISQLVEAGIIDHAVNQTATQIIANVPPHNQEAEARAIYDWVLHNVRYVQDIYNNETLRSANLILQQRAGDCDCINGVLIPSLLGTIGIPARLVTVATNPLAPDQFSHIYAEALVNRRWIAMDAARPGAAWGKRPAHVFRTKTWPLFSDQTEDLGFLGQGWLQDLQSIVQTGSETAANIITAERANPLVMSPAQTGPATVFSSGSTRLSTGNLTAGTTTGYLLFGGAALLILMLLKK